MATRATTAVPSRTFAVADVKVADRPLPEVGYREAVETVLGGSRVESCPSRLHTTLVPAPYHAFVHAVHLAFDGHRPLAISPDHVWLLVCQGFAAHVNANAESLRHRLVHFEGRQKITVRRDDFVKGTTENPWEEVFPEFADKLRDHLGGAAADLMTPRFSTTGAVEAAACRVALMDAVRPYFEYEFMSLCGIPAVTLEGTEADWAGLLERAQALRAFDLGWWIDPLTEVLDQFRAAAAGRADRQWWRSFYKVGGGSGGPYINGHVLRLLPYLTDWRTKAATVPRSHPAASAKADGLPSGLSRAPFRWIILGPGTGRECDMEFVGGFVGVRQDRRSMTLRPEVGWAVRERGEAS